MYSSESVRPNWRISFLKDGEQTAVTAGIVPITVVEMAAVRTVPTACVQL